MFTESIYIYNIDITYIHLEPIQKPPIYIPYMYIYIYMQLFIHTSKYDEKHVYIYI